MAEQKHPAELDVVTFRRAVEGWPEGTSGTIVEARPAYAIVEVSGRGGVARALVSATYDVLDVTWRAAESARQLPLAI